MDQQGEYTMAEIIDLSEIYQDFDYDDSTNWLSSTLDSHKVKTTENHTRECHKVKNNNNNIIGVHVSTEELKIRSELEMEIERDLEEEIKESIYHLALKLHRIYQQRKERNTKETSERKALSVVNISIKMEGGTKIGIKEANKRVAERGYRQSTYRPENVKEVNAFSGNKFDWVKTLRAVSKPVSVNRSNGSLKHKDGIICTDPNVFSNSKFDSAKGKNAGSSGQGKRNASVDNKQLQLGWKV